MKGALVIANAVNGIPSKTTVEALGAGQMFAEKFREPLSVGLIGECSGAVFSRYGVETIYRVASFANECHPEAHFRALEEIIKTAESRFVIFFSDDAGKELAPRMAYRMHAGIVTNVIGMRGLESSDALFLLRPAYGGKAIASLAIKKFPIVLTVKPHAFHEANECQMRAREIEVTIDSVTDADAARLRMVGKTNEEVSGVKLEDAAIVVSGGRGMNGPEGFQKLAELAAALGGAVGASRAATDAGWCSHALQVGQTGKTISPDLYFAFGISGATQHVAGMSGAKTIVAINRDADAPIFKVAHFGIVADAHAILPLLIEKCKALRSE
ncbi:electron transfer flavoprotein subunit alpha/FixB family protein [Patescibacteria group bacterium]|nr:electron transfer flavoprotein subunit alpha/FixB family protein [Patescibacteria group bacterium]